MLPSETAIFLDSHLVKQREGYPSKTFPSGSFGSCRDGWTLSLKKTRTATCKTTPFFLLSSPYLPGPLMPCGAKFVQIIKAANSKIYSRTWREDSFVIYDPAVVAPDCRWIFSNPLFLLLQTRLVLQEGGAKKFTRVAQCTQDLWKISEKLGFWRYLNSSLFSLASYPVLIYRSVRVCVSVCVFVEIMFT